MSSLRALWTTTMGELPRASSPQRDDRLLALVCLAACAAFFFTSEYPARGGLMISATWRLLMFAGVPMAALALYAAAARGGSRVGAAGAAVLLLVPIVARQQLGGKVFRHHPELLALGLASMLVGLLVVARSDERLGDWGVGLGDWRWWLPRTAVFSALLIGGVLLLMHLSPEMARYYPAYKPARTDPAMLALKQASLMVDFLGWELLFRGFLLMAVARRGDVWLALWLQTIPFFILHDHKPELELMLSLPGGLLAGWFCLRARSFLPLFILHSVQMGAVNVVAFQLRA